jgi:hypothetical protein
MGWLKKLFKGNRNRNQVQEQPQDQQQETGPSNEEMLHLMNTVPREDDGPSLLDLPNVKPSDVESEALQARLDGTITPELEDREYKGTFDRYRKLGGEKRALGVQINSNRTSPEDKQKAKDKRKLLMPQIDSMKGVLGDQRDGWMGRHTREESTGGKKLRALGKGAVSETHVAEMKDGRQGVFKGEGALPDECYGYGVDLDHSMSSSREVLSSKVSEMLGSDVIAKSEYGEVEGQRGAFMDFAEGGLGVKTLDMPENLDDESARKGSELGLLTPKGGWLQSQGLDYSDPVLQQKLIELQINDSITGQVDRHIGNYHVQKGEDGKVTGLTGFDNDGSFAPQYEKNSDLQRDDGSRRGHTVGLPPLMDESQAKRIEELDPVAVYQEVAKHLTEEEGTAAMLRVWELQTHVQKLRDEGRIVKEWNDETYRMLREAGTDNSYVARDGEMSEGIARAQEEYDEWVQNRQQGGIGGLGDGGMGLLGVGTELQKLTNVDDDVEQNQGQIVDQAPTEEEEPKKKKRGWFGKKKK